MTRDPGLERVGDDLGTARRQQAERAITAGAVLAVIVAVVGGMVLLVAVYSLVSG